MGAVEGPDAYPGPDDLLPPESLVTHGTVPTRKFRHKRSCYVRPGRRQLNWGDDACRPAGLPPWPAAPVAHRPVVLRQFSDRDVPMAQELSADPYVPLVG